MKHIEYEHQAALIKWAKVKALPKLDYIEENARLISYLYAIVNERKTSHKAGMRLRRQGVKSGVSDLHLALPMNGHHGLWIEMKRPIVKGQTKPTVSDTQQAWLDRMNKAGFKAVVCYHWTEAKDAIEQYLNTPELFNLAA